jgi:hypothetical protein
MTWYGAVRGRSRLSGRGQAALAVTVALAAGCLVLAGPGRAAAAPTPGLPGRLRARDGRLLLHGRCSVLDRAC